MFASRLIFGVLDLHHEIQKSRKTKSETHKLLSLQGQHHWAIFFSTTIVVPADAEHAKYNATCPQNA
jgi:hypothetical protein